VVCGVVDHYSNLEIVHRRIKPGSIAFQCPINEITAQIHKNTLVWPEGDETAYIVHTCERKEDDNGQEIMTVRGYCLKWILSMRTQRLTRTMINHGGEIMNKLLQELTGKRAFPRFTYTIQPTVGEYMTMEVPQAEYLSIFEDICKASNLTLKARWNHATRSIVLTAREPFDWSENNTVGLPVIYIDVNTASGIAHVENITDYKNVMYIVDDDDVIVESDSWTSQGYARFEDCMNDSGGKKVTNPDGSETTLTDAQYLDKKMKVAKDELLAKLDVDSASGDLALSGELVPWGVDDGALLRVGFYLLLGDKVTVRNPAWDMKIDARIEEEKLRETDGVLERKITIGNPLPTIAERIKIRKR